MEAGIVLNPPNLNWAEVPVGKKLQEEFNCPVTVLNDVDAGVYAEYVFGAGQGARCVVGVFPGTGVGGGCVYKGEIFHGAHVTCMEIGHLQVMPEGPLCGCGRRGCLEAVASRLSIAANAAKAAYRGDAPYVKEKGGTTLSDIRSSVLRDAIAAGDEVIEQLVREAARQIGVAVAGIVHLLSPDVVVLGGGLVEAMPELCVDQVSKSARKRVMAAYRRAIPGLRVQAGGRRRPTRRRRLGSTRVRRSRPVRPCLTARQRTTGFVDRELSDKPSRGSTDPSGFRAVLLIGLHDTQPLAGHYGNCLYGR